MQPAKASHDHLVQCIQDLSAPRAGTARWLESGGTGGTFKNGKGQLAGDANDPGGYGPEDRLRSAVS